MITKSTTEKHVRINLILIKNLRTHLLFISMLVSEGYHSQFHRSNLRLLPSSFLLPLSPRFSRCPNTSHSLAQYLLATIPLALPQCPEKMIRPSKNSIRGIPLQLLDYGSKRSRESKTHARVATTSSRSNDAIVTP